MQRKVEMNELPKCAFTHSNGYPSNGVARYDVRIKACSGTWAYLCDWHFKYWDCELGLGKGQELTLTKKEI
jgi:hypothetical protein